MVSIECATQIKWLKEFVAGCDILDGREKKCEKAKFSKVGFGAMKFVYNLRKQAARILQPPNAKRYILEDYYHCLFFTYVRMLNFETVQADPFRWRLAVCGAALAAQVLVNREQARYSFGAEDHLASPCRPIKVLEAKR